MSTQERPRLGGRYIRNKDGSLTRVISGEGTAPEPKPVPWTPIVPAEPADVQENEEEMED